jgi:hypothetical protein
VEKEKSEYPFHWCLLPESGQAFKDLMKLGGHQVFVARFSLKLFSVRSKLAKYGKNNIFYISD